MRDEDFEEALPGCSTSSFQVLEVRPSKDAHIELRFIARNDSTTWAVALPHSSTARLKPWLYAPPDDVAESVRIFGIFLDEEIATTAIYSANRVMLEDATLLELAPYGLRTADDNEDARLRIAAADGGWDGREGSRASLL